MAKTKPPKLLGSAKLRIGAENQKLFDRALKKLESAWRKLPHERTVMQIGGEPYVCFLRTEKIPKSLPKKVRTTTKRYPMKDAKVCPNCQGLYVQMREDDGYRTVHVDAKGLALPEGGRCPKGKTVAAEIKKAAVVATRQAANKTASPGGGSRQPKVAGVNASAAVRWMGREGFTYEQVMAALRANNVTLAESGIHWQLRAGAKPTDGVYARCEIPEITGKDRAELLKFKSGKVNVAEGFAAKKKFVRPEKPKAKEKTVVAATPLPPTITILGVDAERFEIIQNTISCSDEYIPKGKLRGVVVIDGASYVGVAGGGGPAGRSVELAPLIPAAEWKGKSKTYAEKKGPGYEGIRVACRGKAFVIGKGRLTIILTAPKKAAKRARATA